MAGYLDKKGRALAEKLLKKFGKKGSIEAKGEKVYNEDTGQTTFSNGLSIPIHFYIDSNKTATLRANNLIEHNESIALVSTKELGIKLEEQQSLKSGEIDTTIIRFNSVWSGAKIALYEAVVVV